MSCPLNNAGATGICQNQSAYFFEILNEPIAVNSVTHLFAAGSNGELAHSLHTPDFFIIGKYGTIGTDLSTHFTDPSFTGRPQAICAIAKVFYDGACATFHCKLTGNPKNNIFSTRPSAHLSC